LYFYHKDNLIYSKLINKTKRNTKHTPFAKITAYMTKIQNDKLIIIAEKPSPSKELDLFD